MTCSAHNYTHSLQLGARRTSPRLCLRALLIFFTYMVFAFAASPALYAQSCENIPNNGSQSISASITINGTATPVANGAFLPPNTVLRIDSVASAFGNCTGMAWDCSNGCTCSPTGYIYERNINHTNLWADISTATALNGAYTVGYVWGSHSDQHVLDTQSSESTGPNYLNLPYPGSYKIHIQGIINGTPCSLAPYETEDLVITVFVSDSEGATNHGSTSCNSNVPNPVNVTNGNMYLQQTDYRLPGFGEGLELTRTYNSMSQLNGIFGHGWTSTFDESLNIFGANVLRLNLNDGRAVYLAQSSTAGLFLPGQPLDFHGQIVKNADNSYSLTFADGRVHQFSSTGKCWRSPIATTMSSTSLTTRMVFSRRSRTPRDEL